MQPRIWPLVPLVTLAISSCRPPPLSEGGGDQDVLAPALSHEGRSARLDEATELHAPAIPRDQAAAASLRYKPEGQKIIGDNDLQIVDAKLATRYSTIIDAFGFINTLRCTGTHLGRGLVLTAGHCFSDAPFVELDDKSCRDVVVKWGFRAGVAPYLISNCVEVVKAENSSRRDYAIFRVNEIPRQSVEFRSERPSDKTELTLFSHPRGRRLEWSGTCVLRVAAEGRLASSTMFVHQCDTEAGSSGAAVLEASSLTIVGIHDGGSTADFKDRDGKPWGWNNATYSDQIEALP